MNFLFFFLFINPPCSAAAQWMAIRCIWFGRR